MESNTVISVCLFGHSEVCDGVGEGTPFKTKRMLDDMHKRKINIADDTFAINVDGYIGESAKSEVEYSHTHGKSVQYLVPISE